MWGRARRDTTKSPMLATKSLENAAPTCVASNDFRRFEGSRSSFVMTRPQRHTVGDNYCAKKRTPVWLGRTAGFILITSIAILAACKSTNAADWDRLPDGRVIIDIKGIKFAFPRAGNDLVSIHFNEANLQQRATLHDVLEAPDRNRAIFASNANTNISIYVREKGGPFLDRFDRNALKSVSFAFDVGENQKNCSSWARAFSRAKAEDSRDQKVEYGWRESVTAGIETVYTRVTSSTGNREQAQSLYCNQQQYCGSSVCLKPDLSFRFLFSRVDHPQSKWADLLKNINDVLTYIVPEHSNRDAGSK